MNKREFKNGAKLARILNKFDYLTDTHNWFLLPQKKKSIFKYSKHRIDAMGKARKYMDNKYRNYCRSCGKRLVNTPVKNVLHICLSCTQNEIFNKLNDSKYLTTGIRTQMFLQVRHINSFDSWDNIMHGKQSKKNK